MVKLLEAAKRQGRCQPVLEAGLQAQPTWADCGWPYPDLTFEVAKAADLNMERARDDVGLREMQALREQEVAAVTALQVKRTPTFSVNGRSVPQLWAGATRSPPGGRSCEVEAIGRRLSSQLSLRPAPACTRRRDL